MTSNPRDPKINYNQIDHIGCLYFVNLPYHGEFINEDIEVTNQNAIMDKYQSSQNVVSTQAPTRKHSMRLSCSVKNMM
jgi:hypothetical protein